MSTVILAKDYKITSNKTYFFDNNIWILLFAPLINTNLKKQQIASNFLKEIMSYNSEIIVSSIVLSEFTNTFLRFDFEQWKKITQNPLANYKKEYKITAECSSTISEVKNLIKTIFSLDPVCKYPDNFNSINFENVLKNFEIDYNDSYYFEQCLDRNWILVTADNDFDNLDGDVTIIKI